MEEKNNKLHLVIMVLIIGMVSAIVWHYSAFAFTPNYSPVFNSFLHYPANIFCDFYSIFSGFMEKNYAAQMNYLPGIFVPLRFLAFISKGNPYHAVQYMLTLHLVALFCLGILFFKTLPLYQRITISFILGLFNYPVLFTLHTANMEMFCFVLVAYGLFFAHKNYIKVAACLVGFAAAIKLYPAIFLLAIVNKKNWKKILITFSVMFVFIVSFIKSGKFLENIMLWFDHSKQGMEFYLNTMVYSLTGLHFGHSLLNAFRLVFLEFNVMPFFPYITALGIFSFLIIAAIVLRVNRIADKLILITCYICLFPPTSQDYKLLYFLLPLAILTVSRSSQKIYMLVVLLLCLLMVPKNYFQFYGSIYANSNTLINPVIMLFLMFLIIRIYYQTKKAK